MNSQTLDVSCIVLAGGKSKRLGRNKIVEMIGDKNLLEHVICRLSFFNTEIIIVTGKDSVIPQLNKYPKVRVVQDIFPGGGSLGGVYTGLENSQSFDNIVVACDMPFINPSLFRHMLNLSEGYDVVIPRIKNILEPLHAIYSKKCLSPMEFLLKQSRLSILELFPMVNVKYIEDSEVEQYDSDHWSFFNINTETDLKIGQEKARKEDVQGDKC